MRQTTRVPAWTTGLRMASDKAHEDKQNIWKNAQMLNAKRSAPQPLPAWAEPAHDRIGRNATSDRFTVALARMALGTLIPSR